MITFKDFLKLNEEWGLDELPICVVTNDRNSTVEFEHYLHKNDYTWSSGTKYILRRGDQYKKLLFLNFNKIVKTFSGHCLETLDENEANERIEKYEYKLEYPKDFNTIKRFIENIPTYSPKKIVK